MVLISCQIIVYVIVIHAFKRLLYRFRFASNSGQV